MLFHKIFLILISIPNRRDKDGYKVYIAIRYNTSSGLLKKDTGESCTSK